MRKDKEREKKFFYVFFFYFNHLGMLMLFLDWFIWLEIMFLLKFGKIFQVRFFSIFNNF